MAEFSLGWLMGLAVGVILARRADRRGTLTWPSPGPSRLHTNAFTGHPVNGPTTPKPAIVPKPQFPPPRIIREDFLP